MAGPLDWYFRNLNYTELFQIIFSFWLGLIFSPYSWGATFFFSYIVVYEIIYAYFTKLQPPYWRVEARLGVISASILGFLIGRFFTGFDNPFSNNKTTNTRSLKLKTKDQK